MPTSRRMTLIDRLKTFSFPDGEFDWDLRRTYFALRLWVGGLGFLLPIILVCWGLAHEIAWSRMTSISAFYWLSAPNDPNPLLRDWLVGSLCAVGICLIVYEGYGRLENWLLNVAGAALVIIALRPMTWPSPNDNKLELNVHGIASVIFFVTVAATIWFCADDTLPDDLKEVRARWIRIYRVLAVAMLVVPFVAYLIARDHRWKIWVEAFGIWIFSAYWFLKTYEVSQVSKVEPMGGPAPKLKRLGGKLQRLAA
jgi:hypothetical protein